MKKLLVLLFTTGALFACNNSQKTEEQSTSQEISDSDFKTTFEGMEAKTLKGDGLPVYKVLSHQGPNTPLDELSAVPPAECQPIPTTIADLNSGSEFNLYKFDQSMSVAAEGMGFSGSIGKKELVIIEDYVRYKIVNCGNQQKRIGIGLRCFIHVKSMKGKVSGKLPAVAASVELDRAKATFNLKSLGFAIDGSVIAEGLSNQTDYNVENFGKLAITFNNVLKLLSANSTLSINPVILPEPQH